MKGLPLLVLRDLYTIIIDSVGASLCYDTVGIDCFTRKLLGLVINSLELIEM